MSTTIYDKYGGFGAINRIVMAFYDTMIDHDELGPYFDDVEMKDLIDHQTKFISALLGGPASFEDEHLRHAHTRLKITEAHFDEMKRVLEETLLDHGIETADVAQVIEAVERRRAVVQSA
jgi:hemoglobin